MKGFLEWLAEEEHFISYYGRWGIVSAKHGIVYGDKTKNGKYAYASDDHNKLAMELGHKVADGEYAEFYHHSGYGGEGADSGPHLAIRTYGKKSAAIAHKHFDSLPHAKRGDVVHEHMEPDPKDPQTYFMDGAGKDGKRYEIKHNLAAIGGV